MRRTDLSSKEGRISCAGLSRSLLSHHLSGSDRTRPLTLASSLAIARDRIKHPLMELRRDTDTLLSKSPGCIEDKYCSSLPIPHTILQGCPIFVCQPCQQVWERVPREKTDQGRVTYRWVGGEGRVMAHHSASDRSTTPVSRVPPVKAPSPYFTIVLIQLSRFKKRSRGLSKWPIKITRALWLSEDFKNGGSSKTNHSVSVTSMSGVMWRPHKHTGIAQHCVSFNQFAVFPSCGCWELNPRMW